jgi:hypothetical protein
MVALLLLRSSMIINLLRPPVMNQVNRTNHSLAVNRVNLDNRPPLMNQVNRVSHLLAANQVSPASRRLAVNQAGRTTRHSRQASIPTALNINRQPNCLSRR